MFTGLIEAIGRVERVEDSASARELTVSAPFARECRPGDSIAVNGVCLTAASVGSDRFEAVLSPETLRATTAGAWTVGQRVNLERPLRPDGRVGGHFVLGHVDGVGRIARVREQNDCRWVDIEVPAALAGCLVPKGSLAVDGISLTVASLEGTRVGVQIVPFTREHSGAGDWRAGDAVNVEADVLGKYVARLLEAYAAPAAPGRGRS
jgi:riboflavin synthase